MCGWFLREVRLSVNYAGHKNNELAVTGVLVVVHTNLLNQE
jgi:hypothetical protein